MSDAHSLSATKLHIHAGPTRVLHWLSALGLAVTVGIILLRYGVEDGATEKAIINAHRSAGLLVLLLTVIRFLGFLSVPRPQHEGVEGLQLLLVRGVHGVLYFLLFSVPMLGWALSSAAGKPLNFLGVLELPAMLARDRDLADSLATLHIVVAYGLLALVGLHIAAALWHHFVRKDRILYSMLPLARLVRERT